MSRPSEELSPTKRALAALQKMQAKLDILERSRTEPIAVIGMSCRFPGGSDTPERFWQLLREGRDAVAEVPKERWDVDAYYDPDPNAKGKMVTRHACLIDHVDTFDAEFFGISPREAAQMDPQQRLLLEVGWETIESAGIAPGKLRGESVGIFLGSMTHDYSLLTFNPLTEADLYTETGGFGCYMAGRLAYLLGTQGTTLTVSTSCSSSSVALHLACGSLRLRESDWALAGGVNLLLTPHMTVMGSRAHALSHDGRCKTFDASADGYGRGEGCGLLLLKRLSDALAHTDPILALIRGSAVNHDGRASGLTVPNGLAQEKVIRNALANSGIEPSQIGYVETHGTGTSLGDPIEVEALGRVFGRRPDPLVIGSVKTNIAHLEGAAGVAGVMKVILSLQHQEIPPHLNLRNPNPEIPWNALSVTVPLSSQPFPTINGTRMAGVSSFGASGTNAHLILEEGRQGQKPVGKGKTASHLSPLTPYPEPAPQIIVLSARSEEQLKAYARKMSEFLETRPSPALPTLSDIAYTLQTGREAMAERLAMVVSDIDEVTERLTCYVQGASEVEGLYVRRDNDLLVDGKESRELVETLIREREFSKLARLWVSGTEIDWNLLHPDGKPKRIPLPTYPFAKVRHWVKRTEGVSPDALGGGPQPLIDKMIRSPLLKETLFESRLSLSTQPYLSDHRIYGEVTAPAAYHLSMVLNAVGLMSESYVCELENIVFPEPLVLEEDGERTVQIIFTPTDEPHGSGPRRNTAFQLISFTGSGKQNR